MVKLKLYRVEQTFEFGPKIAFTSWELVTNYLTNLMNKSISKVIDLVQYNFNIYDGQMSDKALETIAKTVVADLLNWKIEDVTNFFNRYLNIEEEELMVNSPEIEALITAKETARKSKFKVYAGLKARYGGASFVGVVENKSEKEALEIARNYAIEDYNLQYELGDFDNCDYNKGLEVWLDFYVEEITEK